MDRKVFESESYFLHVKKWLTIQTKKKDEDQPTLVTDTVLAEILAEKEKEDQIVQSFVPYNLVNEDFDARSVIKPIPIKAISSQQRAAFDNGAKRKLNFKPNYYLTIIYYSGNTWKIGEGKSSIAN